MIEADEVVDSEEEVIVEEEVVEEEDTVKEILDHLKLFLVCCVFPNLLQTIWRAKSKELMPVQK